MLPSPGAIACICACFGVILTFEVSTVSCKTCGGRPPVDGIGSTSASMISAKGVELTNFINPDLTWKTVSKGYRRTTRRSRKLIDRRPKSESIESSSDTTVSESEKLGVAVLGQRFGDKIEHVPIKKRRFTVPSPSPLRFSSLHIDDSQQLKGGQLADQKPCSKLISKKLASMEITEAKCGYTEDFSGIEILAAAACNNNVVDEVNHADNLPVEESSREERDKSSSAMPLEGCITSSETAHSSLMDTVHVDTVQGSSVMGNDVDHNHSCGDKKTVEKSGSSRDVRLHWDLNLEMEAWEQPCGMPIVECQTNAVEDVQSEKPQVSEACELQVDGTPLQSMVDKEEHVYEASSGIGSNDDGGAPAIKAIESSTCSGMGAESSSKNVSSGTFINHYSCQDSDNTQESGMIEEMKNPLPDDLSVKLTTNNLDLGAQTGAKENREGSACVADSILQNEHGEGSDMQSSLHEVLKPPQEHPPVPANKTEGKGINHIELGGCDVLFASGTSVEEGQVKVSVNPEEQVGEASKAHAIDFEEVLHESSGNSIPNLGSELQSLSHEACQKTGDSSASGLGRVIAEGTNYDGHVLDVCDKDNTVGRVSTMDSDAGYDSQYEDGELRESDAPYWEDNDFEDGETECVDYGSDTCDYDAAATQIECSEEEFCDTERNMKVEKDLNDHGAAAGDALRQQSNMKVLASDELPGCPEKSSKRIVETPEGKHITDCVNGFDEKESPTSVVGSRLSRKKSPASAELISSDALHGKDTAIVQRSRCGNSDMRTQAEEGCLDHHSMVKGTSNLRIHSKSPDGVHFGNHAVNYLDRKRRELPTYYDGYFGSERSRPRSVIESRVGVSAADNHVHRQVSNGSYRLPFRRRSPTNRDDPHHMHNRGMMAMRDTSPDRRRPFRRYPQGVGRGFREDFHRPIPNESDEYSYHTPNRMIRREQNGSSPTRGPINYRRPYKRSQSRSRSHSPVGRSLQREHDVPPVHRGSRSPEYRFEARMERMRLPFQKQNFAAKCEVSFLSPQRRRFSPQQNSRWFDDPNGGGDHFRGRRLPGRTFQQGQRFDHPVGSSRRLNSDEYFKPMMRPRFSEMGRGGGRARRYDVSDDERRKHDGRGEYVPRVRRYDSDGAVRRFRFDEEENFASRNTLNFNDSDGSGAERRPRNVYMGGDVAKRNVN